MCVSGVAPQLANCNPGNTARYLGHEECCTIWSGALGACQQHCQVGQVTRRLSSCSTLIIGKKDEDVCDTCLETAHAGSSTGSDCTQWKGLLAQCAAPCKEGHKNYASCVVEEPEETKFATPESCRRCVFARSSEVADCLPDSNGNFFVGSSAESSCCGKWDQWLEQCEDECPSPAVAKGSCDLKQVVDANLVERTSGWTAAATCEQCVSRLTDGQSCLAAPTQGCCDQWQTSWASTCRFQCGSEGLEHTQTRLCANVAQSGEGSFSGAPVAALFALFAA